MSRLTWMQAVSASFAGIGYELWGKLMLFIGLVVVVARLVMHPESKALARTIRLGGTRAIRALERAEEYPPGVAQRLEPVARYMKVLDHMAPAVLTAFTFVKRASGAL